MSVETIPDLETIFNENRDRPCLWLQSGEVLTYAAFWERAGDQARRLVELGLHPGDRLVLALENDADYLLLYTACAMAGITACPIDPETPAFRIRQRQRDLGARLVVDESSRESIVAAPGADVALPEFDGERDFVILYSSGTTGEPKGIVHSMRSLLDSARSFNRLSGLGPNSVVCHHFPMFYMAGLFNLFLCPIVAGASIVVGRRFATVSMLNFWELPRRYGVNHLTLTPTMALALSQLYRTDDQLLDHLAAYEAVISTSSTLHDATAKRFQETFHVPLRSCYGVTEVGGSITLQSWEQAVNLDVSVGGWRPETQIRAGKSADETAEILIGTPFGMRGYFQQGQVVPFGESDGLFRSGDLGYVRDGALVVTGRVNDIVKKGGEFVSLVEIENHALACGSVREAAAVAVPDSAWGHRLVLFYVPAPEASEDGVERQLAVSFEEGLRRIERPDKCIPVPWIPRTAVGKVLKRQLVDRYTV